MKLSNSFFYTHKEKISDEDSISSELLVRGGFIKRNSSGIYMFMPLGLKVLKNIENIIRKEMNNINCSEMLMPSLVHKDIYDKTGRSDLFGSSVFTLNDRKNSKYVLGPTHEELFALAATYKINSYKDMPISMYQFQNKFRDEARPRYGLIRVREFIMKDAYTFDSDLESLDISYNKMYEAYKKIFDKIGLKYRIVKADTGVMGGILSEEFQAISEIGEDKLVYCDKCDFSTNIEIAPCKNISTLKEKEKNIEELYTPSIKSIKDLENKMGLDIKKLVKCLVYKINNELMMFLIRGDRTLNTVKISKLFNNEVIEATEEEINTFSKIGFIGPVNTNIKVVVDNEVNNMSNFVVGANKIDNHYINVNIKDFDVYKVEDIRNIEEDDVCPICGNKLTFTKGIEIGNTFKLGTKYSECLNLTYTDNTNKIKPVVMGSYGIGLGRCASAIVEQNNDEFGIIWPISIAPFKVCIVLINLKDEKQCEIANNLYNELNNNNIETILDDRNTTAGNKFNDMDLIGIPIRITIGNKIKENIIEIKFRNKNESLSVNIDNLEEIITLIKNTIK